MIAARAAAQQRHHPHPATLTGTEEERGFWRNAVLPLMHLPYSSFVGSRSDPCQGRQSRPTLNRGRRSRREALGLQQRAYGLHEFARFREAAFHTLACREKLPVVALRAVEESRV